MGTEEKNDAEAILSPSLRQMQDGEEKRVCSKCGKSAVQEVTVGRKIKARHYFCFEHVVVLTEA